jgi:hypothetical protein
MLPRDASTSCSVITLRVFSIPAGDKSTASTSQAACFCAAYRPSRARLDVVPEPK